MSDESYDVVVIGGGISGLAAAKKLQERGSKVVVLEAKNRIGGRMLSGYSQKNNHKVDLGGAYVHPKQSGIWRLAQEYNIEAYDVYDEGSTSIEYNGEMIKGSLPGTVFEKLDILQAALEMEKLGKKIDINNPTAWKDYKKYDDMSFDEWIEKQCVTKFAKDYYKSAIEGGICATTENCSVFTICAMSKAAGGAIFAGGIKGGAQEKKFVGGSAQIPTSIAKDLKHLHLEHVVSKIEQNETEAIVSCENGSTFNCKHVIIAIPPAVMKNIVFSPELPKENQILIDTMRHGKVVKVIMYYETPFWREDGYNGVTGFLNTESAILSSMDDCSPTGEYYALVGFMHTSAEYWMGKSLDERKKAITEQYQRAFKNDKALNPIDYAEHDWRTEEFVAGCYASSCALGTQADNMAAFQKGFKRIQFGGTETATINPGYMDGAIQAGERAADNILLQMDANYKPQARKKEKFPDYDLVTRFIGNSFSKYLNLRKTIMR